MKFLALAVTVLSLYACSDEENKKSGGKDYSSLLNSPPFKGLSDSIRREPANVELLLRRAVLLSQRDLHDAASPDYKKAWEITGDEGIALEYASNLLLASRVSEAIDLLREGNKKFPENTEFSRRLGEIFLQNGQYRRALAEYENMLSRDSSNFEAWYDKGNVLLKMKDTANAITALETSFNLLPINYSGMALANIYVAKKDPRTLEICDILLARDSAAVQTEPLYMKGMYYSEINDNRNALKYFDECIRRDWKMTDAYIEKGIIYFESKNYAEALKTFTMAATVSNTDADAYYWIARCHEATGNMDDAITNYRRALALDETFTEAREALRRLHG